MAQVAARSVAMARTAGSKGRKTAEAIRRAGLRLIYEHGYEGTSLRDLRRRSVCSLGRSTTISPPSRRCSSISFPSICERLTASLDETLAGSRGRWRASTPSSTFHLRYHLTRKMEGLRSIEARQRPLDPASVSSSDAVSASHMLGNEIEGGACW